MKVGLEVETYRGKYLQKLIKVQDILPPFRIINILQISPGDASLIEVLVLSRDGPNIAHQLHEVFFLQLPVTIFRNLAGVKRKHVQHFIYDVLLGGLQLPKLFADDMGLFFIGRMML